MADDQRSARRPFELHVGERTPSNWAKREELARAGGPPPIEVLAARQRGQTWARPALATDSFPWESLGALPRFVGSESTSCVAALQPHIYHNQGAEEFDRFLSAAAGRGETALIVSTIGTLDDQMPRSVLARFDDSISLPGGRGSFGGRRLPAGAQAELNPSIRGADRDLALRLRNRNSGAPWWAIELDATRWEGASGIEVHEPGGVMHPLLVNQLGETLAGVWVPEGRDWRWYVIPAGSEWTDVVAWLVERAMPEYVPAALRRARAAELVDDPLLTGRELEARDAVDQFERDTAARRQELLEERDYAREAADSVRFGLLYGSGESLVAAVGEVLKMAGFTLLDLDAALGAGTSADLLASRSGRHWLVEVKAAGGNVAENIVGDLDRHLQTWNALGRAEELDGGVLVVNHQSNHPPLDRSKQPYTRQAFTASLRHPVVPALALFAWWRDEEPDKVVDAITGPPLCHSAVLADRPVPASQRPATTSPNPAELPPSSDQPPRSRWRHLPRPRA